MKNVMTICLFAILCLAACTPKTATNAGKEAGKETVSGVKGAASGMLKTITSKYMEGINAANEGDYSKSFDMTYPKLFNIQPRAQMEQMMSQMQMMGIKQVVKNVKITDLSNFIPSGKESFAKAKMTSTKILKVADPSMIGMMMQGMEQQGMDMTKVKKTDEGIEMEEAEDLYVIKGADNKMSFLQAGAQMQPMLGQLLPADVLEKLK